MLHISEVCEDTPHQLFCFASDVDIFRNGFPQRVKTEMGNGRDFIATTKQVTKDSLQYVVYKQGNGCLNLTVYND